MQACTENISSSKCERAAIEPFAVLNRHLPVLNDMQCTNIHCKFLLRY